MNRAILAALGAMTLTLGVGEETALAAQLVNGGPGWEFSVSQLDAAGECDQLILVVGEGEQSQEAEVSFYQKEADGRWIKEFAVDGFVGRHGSSGQKTEGDEKTPTGLYSFTMAFGVKEDPGAKLSYHLVDQNDYWVDDSDSIYYNQLVNTSQVKKEWNSAEHLASIVPFYNYGLALDYNSERVPGKGSAVFLHCMEPDAVIGTGGCVKIPEERMKELLQTVDEDCKILIVSDKDDLSQY